MRRLYNSKTGTQLMLTVLQNEDDNKRLDVIGRWWSVKLIHPWPKSVTKRGQWFLKDSFWRRQKTKAYAVSLEWQKTTRWHIFTVSAATYWTTSSRLLVHGFLHQLFEDRTYWTSWWGTEKNFWTLTWDTFLNFTYEWIQAIKLNFLLLNVALYV